MRILHVLDHSIPLQSGYTFRTRAILEAQRARGWQTFHLTSSKQGAVAGPVECVDGMEFHRTPVTGAGMALPGPLEVVRSLQRRVAEVIDRVRPDIVHAHSPVLTALAALRPARRAGVPLVYEVRAFWEDAAVDHGTAREGGMRYRVTRALETWMLRRADAVTTICEGLRTEVIARGIAPDRITVIPNAVDPDRFSTIRQAQSGLAQSLGLEGKRILGFIGSFYAYEGLDLLIEALPRIREAIPEVALLLVGGGPQADALRRRVAAGGLGDAVVFTGRVPHAEVQRYYDLVDVFVYPRKRMRLTELVTPLKPLEAMAQGRLVIASDVGGHRELIRHGETGTLFPAGDVQALARAVVDLLEDEPAWPARRLAARRYVERERSWAMSVARYQGVYDRVRTACMHASAPVNTV